MSGVECPQNRAKTPPNSVPALATTCIDGATCDATATGKTGTHRPASNVTHARANSTNWAAENNGVGMGLGPYPRYEAWLEITEI